MILEDDVRFAEDFEYKVERAISELPEEWDVLLLGGSKHKVKHYSEHLLKAQHVTGAFGYIVHSRAYDYLIEKMSKLEKINDYYFIDFMQYRPYFLTKENIVKHLDGFSLRTGKQVVYPHLK